jgi:predicted RNA-binding protein with PIN domain
MLFPIFVVGAHRRGRTGAPDPGCQAFSGRVRRGVGGIDGGPEGLIMATHIVIDGYNLIFADPRLREMALASLDEARRMLEGALSSYRTHTGSDITLVFDGAREGVPGGVIEHRSGITVIFSAAGRTADAAVEDVTRDVIARERGAAVAVVSSDREVGRRVRRLGARVRRSREFASQMWARLHRKDRPRGGERIDPQKERRLSPREVEAWERLFRERRRKSGKDEGKDALSS